MKNIGLFIITLVLSHLTHANSEVSIPMQTLNKNSAFVVDVSLGQFGSTKMLVDTGASDVVLLDWFAKENQIPSQNINGQGKDSGGNSFELKMAKVDSFTLESKPYPISSVIVVPTPKGLKELGIGGIPNAVLENLQNHKDLGIHTEMFSDGLLNLMEK